MLTDVSVIIPSYNYGRFIKGAIESVLAQTHPVSEVFVVDDGSTDDTEQIVRGFGERVSYLKQANAGVCAARNLGIERSSGSLIAFLDADDAWLPQKLEKQIAKFSENGEFGLVHCGLNEFDSETGETVAVYLDGGEGDLAEDLLLWGRRSVGPPSSVILRREAIEEVGGFDTRLKNGEDWEFCLRVARKYKFGFVPEVLVDYRNHSGNASKNIAEMERSTLIAWEKAFNTDDERILRLKRQSYGNLHKVLAGSYLHNGGYSGFARNVVKSLWYRPGYLGYYLRSVIGRGKK